MIPKRILAFIGLLTLLTACTSQDRTPPNGAAVPPRPALAATPEPDDPALQLYVEAIRSEGTLEAVQATAAYWDGQLTATAQAAQVIATAETT